MIEKVITKTDSAVEGRSNDNRCVLRRSVEGQEESPLLKSDSSGVERLLVERLMTSNRLPRVVVVSTVHAPGVLSRRDSLVPLDYACSTAQRAGLSFWSECGACLLLCHVFLEKRMALVEHCHAPIISFASKGEKLPDVRQWFVLAV